MTVSLVEYDSRHRPFSEGVPISTLMRTSETGSAGAEFCGPENSRQKSLRKESAMRVSLRFARRRPVRSGFTLIEVLLVLAILGVIAAMVVPNLLGTQDRANIKASSISIKGFEEAVKLYAVDHDGQFPEGNGDSVIQMLMSPEQTDDSATPRAPVSGKDSARRLEESVAVRVPGVGQSPIDHWQARDLVGRSGSAGRHG